MDALVSADDSNSMVPGFMISIALSLIASDIGFQRNCTVLENDPEKLLAQIEVPLIYFAARSDTLCKLPKARRMFDGYSGKFVVIKLKEKSLSILKVLTIQFETLLF